MGLLFWGILTAVIAPLYVSAIVSFVKKKEYSMKLLAIVSTITAVALLITLLIFESTYVVANGPDSGPTSKPTELVEATQTPEPTETPEPTKTPEPTETPEPTMTPGPMMTPEPNVVITSPRNGDKVERTIILSGIVDGTVPKDTYLWVVVNPETDENSYWPQEKAILTEEDGAWSCHVSMGDDESSNVTFYIYVIAVNAEDNQYYIDYLNEGRENNCYPPIPLTSSAEELCKVAVVRK